MSKNGYSLGYSDVSLDWEAVFDSVCSVMVYTDEPLDVVTRSVTQRYYIVTPTRVVNSNITYTSEYVSFPETESLIVSAASIIYIKGFLMQQRKRYLLNKLVNSSCDNEFNKLSKQLALDNWKYEFYHKKFLMNKMKRLMVKNTLPDLYDIKRDHQLVKCFMEFIRNCFKLVNNRVFSFIVIGDTKIGKSILFKNCLIDQGYIEYHNSMLEFSKCFDENKKLFRLLDDINWNTVDVMTLKTILNRNIATVDVKYSYGIIYPMINIFLMNKEDYIIFQKKFVDIWSFISNNVAIYPKQTDKNVIEETEVLYDVNKKLEELLFNEIIDMNAWKNDFENSINSGTKPNIYDCVKSKLLDLQPYVYDNKQFIDLTSFDISLLPNRQLIENEMLRRIKEVETIEKYEEKVEKKPKKKETKKRDTKKKKRINPRVNNRNCLDYYFDRDNKRSNKSRNDPYSRSECYDSRFDDTSTTSFNDSIVDDNNIFNRRNRTENDMDDGENEMSLMNDSFIC